MPFQRKAFAYITKGSRLLVFGHVAVPEAGIQVPAGTIEDGETPAQAALREAFEETGLDGLQLKRVLGECDYVSSAGFVHRRHFVHLECTCATAERWRHWERRSQTRQAYEFEHFWVDLPDGVPPLAPGHDAFMVALVRELKTAEASGPVP